MENKSKISKVAGIIGIASSLIAILYKGMLGMRAGWEMLMPFVIVGLIGTIVSIAIKREIISWISLAMIILALLAFFFA